MRRPCLSPPHNRRMPDANPTSLSRATACVARAYSPPAQCPIRDANRHASPPAHRPMPGPVGATHSSPGGPIAARTMPEDARQSPRVAARTSPVPRTGRGDSRPHQPAIPCNTTPHDPRMHNANRTVPHACVARALHRPHNARMRDANRHASPPAPSAVIWRVGATHAPPAAYHRPHNARMRDANRHASPPAHRRCPGPVGATHASPLASTTVRTAPVAAPMATSPSAPSPVIRG